MCLSYNEPSITTIRPSDFTALMEGLELIVTVGTIQGKHVFKYNRSRGAWFYTWPLSACILFRCVLQVESGGTVLSTNWGEVGEKKVEMKPPDGMEWKKYEN